MGRNHCFGFESLISSSLSLPMTAWGSSTKVKLRWILFFLRQKEARVRERWGEGFGWVWEVSCIIHPSALEVAPSGFCRCSFRGLKKQSFNWPDPELVPFRGEHRITQQQGSGTKVNTGVSKSSTNQPALSKKKKKFHTHLQPQWVFLLTRNPLCNPNLWKVLHSATRMGWVCQKLEIV